MRVAIADRYILAEIVPPFLLGVGAFVVILVGDILYTLVEFIATRRLSVDVVIRLLIYKVPAIMVITLPVSTLLGALLGLGRLAKDLEVQAMRLAGISLTRVFAPVLAFGLAVAGLTYLTNEYVAPWANHQANNLIRRSAFGEAFPQVREQVFFRGPGTRFFYVSRIDDDTKTLHDVMIYEARALPPRLITARRARWNDSFWMLSDGVVREFDPDGFTRYEAGFASMEIVVGAEAGTFFAGQKTPEEMTTRELQRYLALFGHSDVSARFAVEYFRKFAVPFASAVFALIAAPLSIRAAQGGRFLGVGLSITLLFVYYVLMSVARALGATGALAPMLGAWLPNLVFGVCGLLLWSREEGWFLHRVPALQSG